MFEGKLPNQEAAQPLAEPSEGESLRPLRWDDLVARLAAVRDLRAGLHMQGDASFDASSARRVAAHHNGKQVVNLEDSSNGKGIAGTADEASDGAGIGAARGAVRE